CAAPQAPARSSTGDGRRPRDLRAGPTTSTVISPAADLVFLPATALAAVRGFLYGSPRLRLTAITFGAVIRSRRPVDSAGLRRSSPGWPGPAGLPRPRPV